ncbi:MAG TPA: hypothetical protein VJC20_00070 [Candidatus Paceibacterota bacterium]
MEQYLPSKRFVVTALFLLALGASGWFVAKRKPPETVPNTNALLQQQQQEQQREILAFADRLVLDSDNDGLRDWEEVIWETDPQNPDTDGDGTPDGEEVKLERDPLKAGPDDKLVIKPIDDREPKTLTEEVAQNLSTRYLATKGLSGGEPLSADQKDQIAGSLSEDIQAKVDAIQDAYTQNDIVISSTKNTRDYANNLGVILEKNGGNSSLPNELDIVKAAAETQDMTKLEGISQYITWYKNIIVFLKKEGVPPAYAAIHLDFLNTINNLKIADEYMKRLADDPIASSVGVMLYGRELPKSLEFFKNLKTQLEKDGVRLNDKDPGASLNEYFKYF